MVDCGGETTAVSVYLAITVALWAVVFNKTQ